MDCKLFDSKSVPATEIVCLWRKSWNPISRSRRVGVRVSKQFCSSQGIFIKASYSTTRKSNQSICWVGQEKFGFGNISSWFIGTNRASSSSSLRESNVLDASDDEYEGVVVNSERLPSNPNVFASILQSSLSYWKLKGKKGVWLKLPVERSELVPIAVKEGFEYHHAERGYIMLTYWIPEGPCMLLANASHQVGVGGFVINEKNEVLVVQEKQCAPAFAGLWKLPTGFIHESEEIFTGAMREVKEETSIDTEFVEVIAFRHAHHVAFDKSDLFFICMLKPLSNQIKVDDLEVQAAKWMPLVEFVEQPLIRGDNMFNKVMEICIARLKKHYCGLFAHQVISKFDGRPSSLYYNVVEAQDLNCQVS